MNNLIRAMNPLGNMMMQVQSLKQQFAGRDPQDIINQMLQSGQINQAQVDQAKQMANSLRSIIK